MNAAIEGPYFEKSGICMPILRALPAWFGIEPALIHYSAEIDHLPTLLAYDGGEAIGFISLKQHTPYAAEIYVMGILTQYHRMGIGRALIHQCQEWLKQRAVEYLQVKTLGSSQPDESYARTRAFYAAVGFRPLEEFKQIWDEDNPCLIMIKKI
jgi:ribosomal protein S18 acetylase RimI-like enzyme